MFSVKRYHDISAGHRVVGHEGACAHLHGHNYRIWFTCEPVDSDTNIRTNEDGLDLVGRVIDFSHIKNLLCDWLERNWDHVFLVWSKDPWKEQLKELDFSGVSIVPFNPTAENMAQYLVEEIGPRHFNDTQVRLVEVTVEETRKCSATYRKRS